MRVALRVANPHDPDLFLDIPDVLVSGARVGMLLPVSAVAQLQLPRLDEIESYAKVELAEKQSIVSVISVADREHVIVGSLALAALGLALDASYQRLVESDSYLLAVR